ncbi:disulfide isomerase [Macrolepiota fuliginosa MF-IS2]|uniref:Disulfide isomerase n=1 Tax=Macrolepiota fuliginosa MF-IS2 TaxID=1400762 RepID=A0A9P5XGK6_9AGAR|nr:disulfide isomerase [Macrolepiota fuliginosa MF-IS2]
MKLSQLLVFVLTPSLALSFGDGLFCPRSNVKMLGPKSFKKALKANRTNLVAFVSPRCGHCQRMAPEYTKAADKLHPLVLTYAVDCDDEKNKPLCAEQQVQSFPTVKLFPRGNKLAPIAYESGNRTSNAFFSWTSKRIPSQVTKLSKVADMQSWIEKTQDETALLLLTKEKKVPLLWKVLANNYSGKLELAAHRDEDGKTTRLLGFEENTRVLVYPAGSSNPVKYEGKTKLEPLTKFFDSILDGTAGFKGPDGGSGRDEL